MSDQDAWNLVFSGKKWFLEKMIISEAHTQHVCTRCYRNRSMGQSFEARPRSHGWLVQGLQLDPATK